MQQNLFYNVYLLLKFIRGTPCMTHHFTKEEGLNPCNQFKSATYIEVPVQSKDSMRCCIYVVYTILIGTGDSDRIQLLCSGPIVFLLTKIYFVLFCLLRSTKSCLLRHCVIKCLCRSMKVSGHLFVSLDVSILPLFCQFLVLLLLFVILLLTVHIKQC